MPREKPLAYTCSSNAPNPSSLTEVKSKIWTDDCDFEIIKIDLGRRKLKTLLIDGEPSYIAQLRTKVESHSTATVPVHLDHGMVIGSKQFESRDSHPQLINQGLAGKDTNLIDPPRRRRKGKRPYPMLVTNRYRRRGNLKKSRKGNKDSDGNSDKTRLAPKVPVTKNHETDRQLRNRSDMTCCLCHEKCHDLCEKKSDLLRPKFMCCLCNKRLPFKKSLIPILHKNTLRKQLTLEKTCIIAKPAF